MQTNVLFERKIEEYNFRVVELEYNGIVYQVWKNDTLKFTCYKEQFINCMNRIAKERGQFVCMI